MARLLALGLFLLLTSGIASAETRDVSQHFFDPKLGDFKAELATAKQEGKQGILLMFEQEDCPFCRRMKTTILNQSEVQDYYHKHFLIFSVDVKGATALVDFNGKDTNDKQFAVDHRVRATPVFLFFDLSGKPISRFTGAAKDIDEFMKLGHYVVEGAYKNMPFTKYKQQGG